MNDFGDRGIPDGPDRDIEIDEGSSPGGFRPSSITWLALALGVALTLVFMRLGVWFFFLPIILPFGLRGGSLFRGSSGRRFVRLDGTRLLLLRRTFAGTSRDATVDVSGGVFIAVSETGARVNGVSESTLRIVADDGAFDIALTDVVRARRLKQRIVDLLAESSVRLVEPSSVLQGGVAFREIPGGVEFRWEGRRSIFWNAHRTTSLRVDGEGWTLEVRSGVRLESRTGGPGIPEARLTSLERVDPFESGVIERGPVLEIEWDGEVVARVGRELSEPELRFVLSRLARAQPRRLSAR